MDLSTWASADLAAPSDLTSTVLKRSLATARTPEPHAVEGVLNFLSCLHLGELFVNEFQGFVVFGIHVPTLHTSATLSK